MRATGCLLVLFALLLAGCGGGGKSRLRLVGPLTTAQVIAGFQRETGTQLHAEDETPTYDRVISRSEDHSRFGSFSIFVIKREVAKNFARLIEPTDGDFARQTYAAPDAAGIVWGARCFKESGDCAYTATKRFATNVVLEWDAVGARVADASWRRLSAALTKVAIDPPATTTTGAPATTTASPTTTAPAKPDGAPIPASRVVRLFPRRTRAQLTRHERTPDWDELGFPFHDVETAEDRRLSDEFGVFTIYVLRRDFDANYKHLITPRSFDDLSRTAEPADPEGIVWTKTCGIKVTCTYAATKRFGDSLVLDWQAGIEKRTTATWDRLAKILTLAAAQRR
ncbi:MAG: hypothetical protein QOE11_1240 [Solirubrobacteraceae bacterium]|jgi:hypothetical protein|nr:hypothetical protein [Solirubrobacteraceae bacterium]